MEAKARTIEEAAMYELKKRLGITGRVLMIVLVVLEVPFIVLSLWFYFNPENGVSNPKVFFLLAIPLFLISLTVIPFAYFAHKARIAFWQEFAKAQGWTYESRGDITKERGLLLREETDLARSKKKSRVIKNQVRGDRNGRPARIFEYEFLIGNGNKYTTYQFTVLEYSFRGTFPHIYVNRKDWAFHAHAKGKLSVSPAFDEKFEFYVPDQYEIEALAIFDESMLAFLLESEWKLDFELIDGRLIIYQNLYIRGPDDLKLLITAGDMLAARLAPALDHARLEKIGTNSTELSTVGAPFSVQ